MILYIDLDDDVYFKVEVDVYFEWPEMPTFDCPGCPASYEINSIKFFTKEISLSQLSEEDQKWIDFKCKCALEDMLEESNNRMNHHYDDEIFFNDRESQWEVQFQDPTYFK